MKFYPVLQGSAEWYGLRLGRPTASNFHKIITPKGAASKQAINYLYRLVCERLLNESADDELGFVRWVERGREEEPNAIRQFEFVNEVKLEPGGFCTTDDGRLGCSPDRLFAGNKQAVEVKSPAPWTLLRYHLEGMGEDYIAQVNGQFLVGEFEAVHFYGYHPQMPPFHKATFPDLRYMVVLSAALDRFCDVLDVTTEKARALGAYVVSRRVETPGEVAYQDDEDMQLKLVNPEEGEDGAYP